MTESLALVRRMIAGAMLAAAVGAAAQIPTSTHDRMTTPIAPSLREVARTDAVFRDAVACVMRYQAARTRALLDTVPGTPAEEAILFSFRSRLNQCYDYHRNQGRAMSFPANLLRGAIAEISYRREYPDGIALAASATPAATAAWARPRPVDGAIGQAEMLHAMARCVTVRRPAGVGALLAAAPFTESEGEAIGALHADFSACLDRGVDFAASRQSLRGLLAEAALHYAEARRGGFAQAEREAEAGSE